jgi:hexosaminidase
MKTVNMRMKGMVLTAILSLGSLSAVAAKPANYNVVPLPQSIQTTKGAAFEVDAEVQILAPAELQNEAEFLQQYLREVAGVQLSIADKRAKKSALYRVGHIA